MSRCRRAPASLWRVADSGLISLHKHGLGHNCYLLCGWLCTKGTSQHEHMHTNRKHSMSTCPPPSTFPETFGTKVKNAVSFCCTGNGMYLAPGDWQWVACLVLEDPWLLHDKARLEHVLVAWAGLLARAHHKGALPHLQQPGQRQQQQQRAGRALHACCAHQSTSLKPYN